MCCYPWGLLWRARSLSSGTGRPVRPCGQCGALWFFKSPHALTALLWGRWQAKLSKDPLGPASPYLSKIVSTHWIRTMKINAYGFTLLVWAMVTMARQ
jgi:hypothetical protein